MKIKIKISALVLNGAEETGKNDLPKEEYKEVGIWFKSKHALSERRESTECRLSFSGGARVASK